MFWLNLNIAILLRLEHFGLVYSTAIVAYPSDILLHSFSCAIVTVVGPAELLGFELWFVGYLCVGLMIVFWLCCWLSAVVSSYWRILHT